MNRITISIGEGQQEELDHIKQDSFYNRSTSEMLRSLINAGLTAADRDEENPFVKERAMSEKNAVSEESVNVDCRQPMD